MPRRCSGASSTATGTPHDPKPPTVFGLETEHPARHIIVRDSINPKFRIGTCGLRVPRRKNIGSIIRALQCWQERGFFVFLYGEEVRKLESQQENSTETLDSLLLGAELGSFPQIDLHGVDDVEHGLSDLDQFLNREFFVGTRAVKIIHGKGTGAMRKAVHAYLRDLPFVDTFRDSHILGEIHGATVVVFTKRE
jgi:dsDNA-specific endonuclease/ATPase MutS2